MSDLTRALDLLSGGEDLSSIAGFVAAIRAVQPYVTHAIGGLMLAEETDRATDLRDHAQMLPGAAAFLENLYREIDDHE